MAKKSNKQKYQEFLERVSKENEGIIASYIDDTKTAVILVPFNVTKASFNSVTSSFGVSKESFKSTDEFLQAHGLAPDTADVASAADRGGYVPPPDTEFDVGFGHPELQVLEEPPSLPVDIVGGRPVNTVLKPGDTVCLLSDPGRHFTVVMQADNFVSLSFINDRGKIDFTAAPLDTLGRV